MSEHDVNRRQFVGLLGLGVAQGLIEPQPAASPVITKAGNGHVANLLARIEQLESQVSSLLAALGHTKLPSAEHGLNDYAGTIPVHTLDRKGEPLNYPIPLDSMVQWQRREDPNQVLGTSQILSLVHENTKPHAYPWTLSTFLRTNHNQGDAVANFVRLQNHGGGWAAGFHAETYHRNNGGASIGANIEAHSESSSGRVIGLNVLAVDWNIDDQGMQKPPIATKLSEAINVQSFPQASWKTGLNFDLGSKGDRAIWIQGTWKTGIDVGANDIVMNANNRLYLEETKQVYLTCNTTTARIEFHWGDRLIGYIPYNAAEHAL
ncbi:hypothetical protein ACP8Y2_11330 [Herpetosiphon llansteffanensis]